MGNRTLGVFYLDWREEFAGSLVDQTLALDGIGDLFKDFQVFEVGFVSSLAGFLKFDSLEVL
jgi:hypothetical protein